MTLGLGQGYNSFLRETGPGVELHVYNPSTEVEAKDGKFEASLGYILSSRPARGTWGGICLQILNRKVRIGHLIQ